MSFKYIAVLLVASVVNAGVIDSDRPFKGVDPNTLSCDPEGQIFLLLPSYTDCNKFYMCTHGQEVQFSCSSPALIFDFEQQACDWPNLGTCILRSKEDGGEGGSSDEGSESSEEESSSDEGSGEGSGFDPGSFEESPNYNNRPFIDCRRADTASKQVAYSGDCQRYWRCVRGVPQTAYCSDGLFFNPHSQQCDYEANVKCNLEQVDELQGEFIVYKQY